MKKEILKGKAFFVPANTLGVTSEYSVIVWFYDWNPKKEFPNRGIEVRLKRDFQTKFSIEDIDHAIFNNYTRPRFLEEQKQIEPKIVQRLFLEAIFTDKYSVRKYI